MMHIPSRARLLTAVVVLSNVLGNLALSLGVKNASILAIGLGVSLLIIWTLSRITLMSWADLSFILPITSGGYILTALASKFVLAENISGSRWWGTLLIFSGMVVVSRTKPLTKSPKPE